MIFQSTLPARGATGTTSTKHTARIFQSTLPARGATTPQRGLRRRLAYFNPRSPHGERPKFNLHAARNIVYFNPRSPHGERRVRKRHHVSLMHISIHAPRTGSDPLFGGFSNHFCISIHAPRTGSDQQSASAFQSVQPYFNPRSPHGERHVSLMHKHGVQIFQSTLPARGATTPTKKSG